MPAAAATPPTRARGTHGVRRRLRAAVAVLAFTALLPLGAAAATPAAAADATVTLVGDLQSELGCPGDWQPDCAATHMTAGADGVYRLDATLPGGTFAYKAAIADSWAENYGKGAQPGGDDIALTVPSGGTHVRFYYDPVTHWVTDSIGSRVVTAAGSFQSELGCAGDWSPDCLRSWLQDPDGDGTYTFETTALPKGSYEVKAAVGESWGENYGQGGARDGANIGFTVPADHAKVSFSFDSATNRLSVATGHRLDDNVEYDGLAHDSRSDVYRTPGGVVNPGTAVTLRLRTYAGDVSGVTLRLWDGQERKRVMTKVASDVSCYDEALDARAETCDYWAYTYTPSRLGTVYYRFIVKDGTATAYYADNDERFGGVGRATPTEVDTGYKLHVVDPTFAVVPWMRDGVMYQIFPDRFYNGDTSNDPKPTDPRYAYPAPAGATAQQQKDAADAQVQKRAWTQLPEGYCRSYASPATPCTESPKGRDYFGGDLLGIDKKLDYLRSAGVTVLYLNPVFESGSNHGYDTRDYDRISHYFGSNGYFKHLVADAKDHGIRIVLDGVFNHMSSDSPMFDRYHHFTTVGACESTASPYRSWFVFTDVEPGKGTCVDSKGRADAATYKSWAGFDSIPEIVKRDPADTAKPYQPVADYFWAKGEDSVVGKWLSLGTSGWRFDVMQDPSFPPAYWQGVRDVTKGITPDATLIAEAWHWYDNLPLTDGDTADTPMGYRFRAATLSLLGATDDKGFPGESSTTVPVSKFRDALESVREDYADATYYTFMNLLDSHDTKRALWSLTPGKDNREDKELDAANVAVGKAKLAIANVVQFTVPGTPTVYYGDEVGMTGADDPDDRRPFPWRLRADGSYAPVSPRDSYFGAAGDHAVLDRYRALTALRKAHPVLARGTQSFLLADDKAQTVAWAMHDAGDAVITVVNRSETDEQKVVVPTAGVLRDGLRFRSAYGPVDGTVTTDGGSVTVTLPKLSAAVLVLDGAQDVTPTKAPGGLTATMGAGTSVELSWSPVPGAASYVVYRSPLSGGGFAEVARTDGASYVDDGAAPGRTYYYVVRALDTAGNLSAPSAQADATPALPIGWTVLQWPKTIDLTIGETTPTIYGQVYVAGLTDAGGRTDAIRAEVGYGPAGSTPSAWTSWTPMSFNTRSGNNYEYQGTLRPELKGTLDYLVRFSDDGGRTWAYGDQDGTADGDPGTDSPGVLTVSPSSDTTPPSAPKASIDYAAASLTVSWTASTDADGVAEYRVYRGTAAGAEGATPVATVSGSTTSWTDTDVDAGSTYFYVVRALDASLNASAASNEVSHEVQAKMVKVTFRVQVPGFTPPGDTVYVTGQTGAPVAGGDPLCGYCGGSPATAMHETSPGIWETTLDLPDGAPIEWKYTRGSYDTVEWWGAITGFTNRKGTVKAASASDLTMVVDNTSASAGSDDLKPVGNWRDALVTGSSGAASAVDVTLNWDVAPTAGGSDYSGTLTVTGPSGAVTGTTSYDATAHRLHWTPASTLPAGSYTVKVDGLRPTFGDGIAMQHPWTRTLTVGQG